MKNSPNRTLLSVAILAVVAVELQAAPHYRSGVILDYDLNSDDQLSAEEFLQARRDRFNNTDTDGNGQVDVDEYVYEWEGRLQDRIALERKQQVDQTFVRFGAVNKDDDKYISRDEFDASGQRGFDYLDQDKDGVILTTDSNPVREGTSDEDNRLRRVSTLQMPSTHTVEGMIEIYDLDGDEQVTYAEYLALRSEIFAGADEDQNGAIDEQEYVLEFEDRLDAQIEDIYTLHIEAAYNRFGFLDDDENDAMTFKEYMLSGNRVFNRWDTSGDGHVTAADPLPSEPEENLVDSDATENVDSENTADTPETDAVAQAN